MRGVGAGTAVGKAVSRDEELADLPHGGGGETGAPSAPATDHGGEHPG